MFLSMEAVPQLQLTEPVFFSKKCFSDFTSGCCLKTLADYSQAPTSPLPFIASGLIMRLILQYQPETKVYSSSRKRNYIY